MRVLVTTFSALTAANKFQQTHQEASCSPSIHIEVLFSGFELIGKVSEYLSASYISGFQRLYHLVFPKAVLRATKASDGEVSNVQRCGRSWRALICWCSGSYRGSPPAAPSTSSSPSPRHAPATCHRHLHWCCHGLYHHQHQHFIQICLQDIMSLLTLKS